MMFMRTSDRCPPDVIQHPIAGGIPVEFRAAAITIKRYQIDQACVKRDALCRIFCDERSSRPGQVRDKPGSGPEDNFAGTLYRRRKPLCGGQTPLGMQMSVLSAAVILHCSNETNPQFEAPLRP
jgi:hypothetical protein